MQEWVLEKATCGTPLENGLKIYKPNSEVNTNWEKKRRLWPCLRVSLEEWCTREKGQYGEHRFPRMLSTEMHCSLSYIVPAIHR